MIKGIFFDVGGTLCSSSENINKKPSFKKVLSEFTHRPLAEFNIEKNDYLWKLSGSKKDLTIRLCEDLKIDNFENLYRKLSSYSYKVSLYKDVKSSLKKLSVRYRLGLLSNTTMWTDFDHNNLGIGKYVEASVLSCRIGIAKPDIKIFNYAQKIIGINREELLYVGDSIEHDMIPALKAKWKAVLLCRDGDIKKSPTSIISNLFELEKILLEL